MMLRCSLLLCSLPLVFSSLVPVMSVLSVILYFLFTLVNSSFRASVALLPVLFCRTWFHVPSSSSVPVCPDGFSDAAPSVAVFGFARSLCSCWLVIIVFFLFCMFSDWSVKFWLFLINPWARKLCRAKCCLVNTKRLPAVTAHYSVIHRCWDMSLSLFESICWKTEKQRQQTWTNSEEERPASVFDLCSLLQEHLSADSHNLKLNYY